MPSDATIPMPSDAAGWAVAEMKRLLTSRRMGERDAVQAACRRASAMKTAAGALASLASSSDGMPASLVKYVAELTTTDMPIDSGVISRCRTWLATNKHEMMKCKTPLAKIASLAPIVDASINNKAKALDPTLTEACHAALKLMAAEKAAAVAAAEGGFGGKGDGFGKGGGGKGKGGGRVDDFDDLDDLIEYLIADDLGHGYGGGRGGGGASLTGGRWGRLFTLSNAPPSHARALSGLRAASKSVVRAGLPPHVAVTAAAALFSAGTMPATTPDAARLLCRLL